MKLGEKMARGKMVGRFQPNSGRKWQGGMAGRKQQGENGWGGNGCKGIKSKEKDIKRNRGYLTHKYTVNNIAFDFTVQID